MLVREIEHNTLMHASHITDIVERRAKLEETHCIGR